MMDNRRTSQSRRGRERRTTSVLRCEVMERRQLLSALWVTDTNDDTNPNSLRGAILQANADGGGDTIDFDISGQSPISINLSSPLPALTSPVTIDGTTQPGYEGTPLVQIDGAGISGAGNSGLILSGGGSTIQGLAIVGFTGAAVVLESGNGNVVDGNYLGVAPDGTTKISNGMGLAILGSSLNTVGSGSGGSGNVISGNKGDGILIEPQGTQSSANQINGNWIGTMANGTVALGNTLSGIAIEASPGNVVGSPGQGFGNVVSGNLGAGISVTEGSTGTQIQNNLIGLAEDGLTPLGNGGDGIQLDDALGTVIGGTDYSLRNDIACNHGDGINTTDQTTGLLVAGNDIGTDITGLLSLGNLGNGISLGSSSNTIGGSGVGAANVIEFNGNGSVGAGVELVGNVNHDLILSNSIYANAGLGINLGSGPTPNHAPGTVGPNDYQNYPTLTIAQSDSSETTIQGTLSESPNSTYLIQFFSSPTEDSSGHGQGKLVIGSASVTTDGKGNGTFTAQFPTGTLVGQFISATATSSVNDTSEFASDVAVQGQVNLQLTAAATPNPVQAGGDLTYTLIVANEGFINADDVILNDLLPGGVSVNSITSSQGYVLPVMPSGSITVNLGTIAAGSSATVTIVVQTGAASVGSITDTATVSSEETDPDTADESATIATTVLAVADLAVTLGESPSPALDGGDLTYTMTVSNQGPSTAGSVVAILPVASGASFVSASTGVGSVTYSDGQVVANLGNLPVNAPVTVTVVLQALTVGELTESASVSGNVVDPNPPNNTTSVTTEIDPATDLSVQIAASVAIAGIGEDFEYIVTATNNGPIAATNVALSDSLPAGVSFVSATTDQDVVPNQAGGLVAATFATLGVGDSVTLTIVVNPTAAPGSILIDSASVAGQQPDPNLSNNNATLDLTIQSVSDLAVVATAQTSSALVGQPITYTITVTNQGPADEPDAVLSGALPAGMVMDSLTWTQGGAPTFNQGILTADLGPLPANATATVTLIASAGATDTGPLTAAFTVQGQNIDPDPSNNTAQVTVNVAPATNLSVAISPGPGPVFAQTDWTYTLKVSNPGPSDATGVTVTSTLPTDVEFVSASYSLGVAPTEQNGTITANVGTLAAGGSETITIVIQPTPAAAADGSIVLSATVAGSEADLDPGQAQATLTVPVLPSVRLAVTLKATPQTIQSGQTITFMATVTNLGTTPATDVSLMLPSVSGLVYGSSSLSQGTAALIAGQPIAQIGGMSPGASITFTEVALATTAGTFTQSASLSDAEFNLDSQGTSASTTAVVLESSGTVEFGAANVSVSNVAGVAEIPVVRLYGTGGTITVNYQTIAVNATPGVDYINTVGTLTMGPGQSSGFITVPVLNDVYENHNDSVNVVLSDPTGGAVLGGLTTAGLQIVDSDPDVTPPRVTGLTWTGSSRSISTVTLTFSAPLDPTYATNPANYQLVNLAGGGSVAIASIGYNPFDVRGHVGAVVPAALGPVRPDPGPWHRRDGGPGPGREPPERQRIGGTRLELRGLIRSGHPAAIRGQHGQPRHLADQGDGLSGTGA